MKTVFFETRDWEKEYLEKALPEATFFSEKFSAAAIAEGSGAPRENAKDAEVVSVFVDSKIDASALEKLPNLKLITVRATGYDNIDVIACKEKGITVCNVPFYGENTVAEHAFALLLDLSRKIYESVEGVKKEGFNAAGLTGFDLKGKTIGIVGMGHIGQHVARIAAGFEMNIVAADAHEDKKLAKKLGFTYMPLEDLLKSADIITLHVPHNEHTHHLINANNIGLIKKGAYLINTARGGIVETDALVKALDSGTLAGAGLDVLEEEPAIKEEAHLADAAFSSTHDMKTLLENHILMERKNVIITPHNAFNSREALARIMETTVENIQSFEKGNVINQCTT